MTYAPTKPGRYKTRGGAFVILSRQMARGSWIGQFEGETPRRTWTETGQFATFKVEGNKYDIVETADVTNP